MPITRIFVPKAISHLVDGRQLPSTEWYTYLSALNVNDETLQADIDALAARIEALEGDVTFIIAGPNSVAVNGTPAGGVVSISLVNDVLSPGNTYYYGTGPTGVKGWFTVASAFTATQDGIELVTGSNGVTDIRPDDDLEALEALSTTGFSARTAANTWALRTFQNGPGVDWTNPGGVAGNPVATFNSHTAPVDRLTLPVTSTYSTVQDFINTMHSPGTIDGPTPVITESGIPATPIRVLAGKGMIRVADDDVSSLPFFDWSQTDFAQAADGLTRFYGVVYNAGSPVVQQRTSFNWDKDTELPLGSAVIFPGGVAVITANPYKTGDPITNIIQRFDAQSPAIRDASIGGLILGETGTRNSTLTAGKIWSRLSDYDSAAKNSATTPMLSAFFNGTGLTVASGLTEWDNTSYNNVAGGTLVAMGANKYANLWFFISIDGTKWGFAYGTNEYNTLGAAANEGVPVYLNQNFFQQALLLGRLIFQQGAATASLIESAFTQLFNTAAINNHNDLNGIQDAPDAAANEHYHLSSAQATAVASAVNAGGGFVTIAGAQTVTGAKTLTGMTRLQNGLTSGSVVAGADVNNVTVTNGSRKIFRCTLPAFNNSTISPMFIFGADTNNTLGTNVVQFGGLTGGTGFTAATAVRFATGSVIDETGGTNRWEIDSTGKFRPLADITYAIGETGLRVSVIHVQQISQYGARFETGVVSPAQIVANTDNWAVTGITTAAIIRATTDASRNLTGIASPTSGQMLRLINVGAQDLVLVHDATSTAANRFLLPNSANLTLNPNDSVSLWYDNTSSRWRALGV